MDAKRTRRSSRNKPKTGGQPQITVAAASTQEDSCKGVVDHGSGFHSQKLTRVGDCSSSKNQHSAPPNINIVVDSNVVYTSHSAQQRSQTFGGHSSLIHDPPAAASEVMLETDFNPLAVGPCKPCDSAESRSILRQDLKILPGSQSALPRPPPPSATLQTDSIKREERTRPLTRSAKRSLDRPAAELHNQTPKALSKEEGGRWVVDHDSCFYPRPMKFIKDDPSTKSNINAPLSDGAVIEAKVDSIPQISQHGDPTNRHTSVTQHNSDVSKRSTVEALNSSLESSRKNNSTESLSRLPEASTHDERGRCVVDPDSCSNPRSLIFVKDDTSPPMKNTIESSTASAKLSPHKCRSAHGTQAGHARNCQSTVTLPPPCLCSLDFDCLRNDDTLRRFAQLCVNGRGLSAYEYWTLFSKYRDYFTAKQSGTNTSPPDQGLPTCTCGQSALTQSSPRQSTASYGQESFQKFPKSSMLQESSPIRQQNTSESLSHSQVDDPSKRTSFAQKRSYSTVSQGRLNESSFETPQDNFQTIPTSTQSFGIASERIKLKTVETDRSLTNTSQTVAASCSMVSGAVELTDERPKPKFSELASRDSDVSTVAGFYPQSKDKDVTVPETDSPEHKRSREQTNRPVKISEIKDILTQKALSLQTSIVFLEEEVASIKASVQEFLKSISQLKD